jgi:hypothetical protein
MTMTVDRRSFLKCGLAGLACAGFEGALSHAAPRQDLREEFVGDWVRGWRESIPRKPVDESDPNVFVLPRLEFRTLTMVRTLWDAGRPGDENLLAWLRLATNLKISNKLWSERVVAIHDAAKIYTLPFVFMTGEGDFQMHPDESRTFGEYFKRGGFLYADDCVLEPNGDFFYTAFLREIQKAIPGDKMKPVPPDHEIYHCFYDIPGGKSPYVQGNASLPDMGLFLENRLVCFLTAGDVHCGWWAGPPDTYFRREHEPALRMGTNIVLYALTH